MYAQKKHAGPRVRRRGRARTCCCGRCRSVRPELGGHGNAVAGAGRGHRAAARARSRGSGGRPSRPPSCTTLGKGSRSRTTSFLKPGPPDRRGMVVHPPPPRSRAERIIAAAPALGARWAKLVPSLARALGTGRATRIASAATTSRSARASSRWADAVRRDDVGAAVTGRPVSQAEGGSPSCARVRAASSMRSWSRRSAARFAEDCSRALGAHNCNCAG